MIVSPSLLAADFLNLERDIKRLNSSNCDYIHLDVMDGYFVEDITFGYPLINKIKRLTNKKLDVHLMVQNPTNLIKKLVDLKVDLITIHVEILDNVDFDFLVKLCLENNVVLGIAFNPNTNINEFEKEIRRVKFILLMSVYPGKGGQVFIEDVLNKVEQVRNINSNIMINIDGGINGSNIEQIRKASIDMVVSGSYIFTDEMNKKIEILKCSNDF